MPPTFALIADGYLEQILDNLIANALDAAREGNRITVSATTTQQRVRVVVADDGPGMSEAEMDRAFRRFATSTAGGSGLGPAIVYPLPAPRGGPRPAPPTPHRRPPGTTGPPP